MGANGHRVLRLNEWKSQVRRGMEVIKTVAASNWLSSLKSQDNQSAGENEKADDTCAGSTPAVPTISEILLWNK